MADLSEGGKNVTKIIEKSIIIHNVPSEKISVEENTVTIDFDDIYERRHKIQFTPYQAIKITTADCFRKDVLLTDETLASGRYQRYILEIENSQWTDQLKRALKEIDENASFMEHARHFVLDLGDEIVEIAASGYALK